MVKSIPQIVWGVFFIYWLFWEVNTAYSLGLYGVLRLTWSRDHVLYLDKSSRIFSDLVYGVSYESIRRIGLVIGIRRMLWSHTPYTSSYVSRWKIGAGYAVSFKGIRRIGLGSDQNVDNFIDFVR